MDIQILEKPENLSWEIIQNVLNKAHQTNREKGIVMRKPSLPAEELAKEVGEDGVMLVAMDGSRVVGTAALLVKECSNWYSKGQYGYLCFASVLPEYAGKGIYKRLSEERDRIARSKGLNGLLFDTHHKNSRVIAINRKNGFKRVGVRIFDSHWNIVLFKWLNGSDHSSFECFYHYCISLVRMQLFRIKRALVNG